LKLVTVRDAGHEVPWYQGERMKFALKEFLGIPNNCSTVCTTCIVPP
jgi:hypothetical protein